MSESSASGSWKKCSLCKKDIAFGAVHYRCSQKSCQSKNLGLYFCSYSCWDGHKGMARHRDAWAEEEVAPAA